MASRQVLKLCEKIYNDVGVKCDPESFHVERMNYSHHVWNMDVDVENSPGFSDRAKEEMYDPVLCTSGYYMKDLLRYKKLRKVVTIDESEVLLFPSKDSLHDL